jgi:putative flippase GtrA
MLPRYFLASLVALAVDYFLYVALVRIAPGMSLAEAAAPAYLAGAVVHYFFSRLLVFPQGWLHRHHWGEFGVFILSGLFGAGLTSLVVWIVSTVPGAGVHWPKIVAIGVSFIVTYFVRKYLVFRSPENREHDRAKNAEGST